MESKVCGKCKVLLPTDNFIYFFEKSRNKWRYSSYCKSCQKQNAKKHYRDNQEKCIDTTRKWKMNNKEKCEKYLLDIKNKVPDWYVVKLLNQSNVSEEFIQTNPEVIQARRLQLKIKRKIKELKNGTKQIKRPQ